jgi:DNA-directed RNA polymerase subunit beta'
MVLTRLPVTPPDTRPIIQLNNGKITTSDINDFYRKIINRNNRLKEFIAIKAPSIILNNEKRLLQESVDTLYDNASRPKPSASRNLRILKSLTDHLKGKSGLFRQNLLGKRVDYSGRSVIVAAPDLKMYQAGVPTEIALIIYEPFIVQGLLAKTDEDDNEIIPKAKSISEAEKLIQSQDECI